MVTKNETPVFGTEESLQNWATFLHNHAAHISACDFLLVTEYLVVTLYRGDIGAPNGTISLPEGLLEISFRIL